MIYPENIENKAELKLPFYFISDVHFSASLNEEETEKRRLFAALTSQIRRKGGTLFILGDFFDFWFDYPHYADPALQTILDDLASLVKQGVDVHFIAGNHDYWSWKSFRRIGVHWYPDHISFSHENKKFYLCHGDGLLASDTGYRLLKRIFRNPVAVFAFRLLGPRFGMRLGLRQTRHSRKNYQVRIPLLQTYADEMVVWQGKRLDEGVDVALMGHIHFPEFVESDGKYRCVIGDWVVPEHRYRVVWDGSSLRRESL